MSVYERCLLPRLIDLAMRNPEATRYRKKMIPAAQGRVLELGAGFGPNLPSYGSGVTALFAFDPSAELLVTAHGRRARC